MSEQEAYEIFKLSEQCSKQELKERYLELVKAELRCEQPSGERLVQYQEAYDMLLDKCVSPHEFKMTRELWRVIQVLLGSGSVVIIFLMVSHLDQYASNENKETLSTWMINKDESLSKLASDFELTIGSFESLEGDGFAYQDLGETWLIVVPIKVQYSHPLGALISNKQFYLDNIEAVDMDFEALSYYPLLQSEYFLGLYYELVPEGEQFAVSFYTTPFEVNESRTLIFENYDGKKIELAILNYKGELPFANEQNFVEN